MEDMKAKDLNEILTQSGRLQKDGDSYSTYVLGDPDIYYFGKDETSDDGTHYDVLITVNPQKYLYDQTVHNGTLMNNYKMPDIAVMDDGINGMFFSNLFKDESTNKLTTEDDPLNLSDKSMDQIALTYFKAAAEAYADEEFKKSEVYNQYLKELADLQNGKTAAEPTEPKRSDDPEYANPQYCDENYIKDWTIRTSDIKIDGQPASDKKYSVIDYKITYQCNWPSGIAIEDDTVSYTIEHTQYTSLLHNVYFYYQTSLFQKNDLLHPDIISITNQCGKTVDFYIVKQTSDTTDSSITIQRGGSDAANIYTNMNDSNVEEAGVEEAAKDVKKEIVTSSDAKSRIYTVKVQVYHSVADTNMKYQKANELYTLESNIEE
jgi:translation initiation factor 1 (eIF-1/SUI1)